MEYESQDGNGQLEWLHLVGDSAIPEKVRIGHIVIYSLILTFIASMAVHAECFDDTILDDSSK